MELPTKQAAGASIVPQQQRRRPCKPRGRHSYASASALYVVAAGSYVGRRAELPRHTEAGPV